MFIESCFKIVQALDAGLLPYLLGLLEGRLESVENGAATKAQIVNALKAMGRSILYGERVNSLLQQSSVWSEYRDQKHDLFIRSTPISGCITGKFNTHLCNSENFNKKHMSYIL